MRISDWSSDVCSSDLRHRHHVHRRRSGTRCPAEAGLIMATKRKPSWHDDEITAVAELARGFFDRELIAKREQWDAQHRVDRSVWLEDGQLGLLCCSSEERRVGKEVGSTVR